jgi:predicted thioesterase
LQEEAEPIMDIQLIPGASLVLEKYVGTDDTASKYGSGLVEVFATPALVAFMENTALNVVLPHLPEEYNTVGIDICIKHLKATPVGMKIRCKAVLERTEGKKLYFSVTAWDEEGKIGEGTHTRYVIQTEEFMKSLQK